MVLIPSIHLCTFGLLFCNSYSIILINSRINKFNGMILKISLIMIAISMTACSSLSGSFANRSNQLSSGLQNAYSVAPNTANRLSPMIVQSAERYDVSPTLLAALIRQESNFNSSARSPTGAIGLTQIISSYWVHLALAICMMKIPISTVVLIFFPAITNLLAVGQSRSVLQCWTDRL
jgi:hypothetical protein